MKHIIHNIISVLFLYLLQLCLLNGIYIYYFKLTTLVDWTHCFKFEDILYSGLF